ncbi:membrane dipeptidase [Prevotella sp. E13-17]|uniref:membrane dipeptidase n=1 Tax=Prevotella sp. E13-17 TaxID=2913616 RepID=UPI001EDBEB4E|nr:membrane dipeptidase [Prevotella sp. E13-17]UKK50830.1 membrane dipeptidase [Prevotella sp. E13-17]
MNTFDLKSQTADAYRQLHAAKERPVIGITGNYNELTCKLAEGYYKQIITAGGTPVIIPPTSDKAAIMSVLEGIDALLLSGGADYNPLYAGEEPCPKLGGINTERDLPELLIAQLAFNRQMPILGICRGIQTLAMALGGHVKQDISDIQTVKHSQDADRTTATHTVTLEEDSTLYAIYKPFFGSEEEKKLAVNSFHHQAVDAPGPHFRAVGHAADGIIEAIESTEFKSVIGVQWHPECMGDDGLPLFQWLVSMAKEFRQVQKVHDRILTLDTHCDTPMFFDLKVQSGKAECFGQNIHFEQRDKRILVDLPKMTEGRLDATIMVAYIPQKGLEESPKAYADGIFDQIERIAKENSAYLSIARTPAELLVNKQAGRKSIMLGIENGHAIEGRIENLEHFAQRGIVYMTLCHNGDNDICDSAKGSSTHGGVSAFGEQVIRRMNELGVMVDLSHAAETSFYDALEISNTPIVCSHSSARALCNHPRNLTDEQMLALAKAGGVCQITLYPGFLRTDEKATIMDAMAHLDHAIKVMGIDHVGLGTDFDGDGGVPGLANASELSNFTRQLLQRRYSEADIQQIWGGNFLRVMQQVQQQH